MAVLPYFFALVCHQLPGRSPQFEGLTLPFCYRCAGLYFGMLSAYLYLVTRDGWRQHLPGARCMAALSPLMLPFLVDGWGNTLQLWVSPGWLRALSGLGVGIVLPPLLLPLAHEPLATAPSTPRLTLSHPAKLVGPLVIGLVLVGLLMYPRSLLIFQGLAYIASVALLLLLINISLVVRCGWKNTGTTGAIDASRRGKPLANQSPQGSSDHERAVS
jgi:uncharacterized membrane protein